MTANPVTLRTALKDRIIGDSTSYVLDDLNIEETWYPAETLEDVGDKPDIKVISQGWGEERTRNVRNVDVIVLDIPVLVEIIQRIDPTDTDVIDVLLELTGQVMVSCENDDLVPGENFNWMRTSILTDEDGLPFDGEQFRQQHVYHSMAISTYRYIRQP